MKRFLIFAFFTSCTSAYPILGDWAQRNPVRKEEIKLAMLQKKLDAAQDDKRRAGDEVDALQLEVQEAQISFVSKQLDLYERKLRRLARDPEAYAELLQTETTMLFLREREMLHELVRSGGKAPSFEAQQMLDRILRLITQLNDERRLDSEPMR